MASFPTPPGPRIAYDLDPGIAVVRLNRDKTTVLDYLSQANLDQLQDYSPAVQHIGGPLVYCCLLFPEPHDISGYCLAGELQLGRGIEWSNDTTTGLDGTWTGAPGPWPTHSHGSVTTHRTAIKPVDWQDCVGVRAWAWAGNDITFLSILHLYGTPSTPSGLMLWDDTTDQQFDHAGFDTGDTIDGQQTDIALRIKNLDGAAKTNVTLSMETREPLASFAGMHQVDADGAGFQSFPINIGSLAAGAISQTVTIRQTIDDANLGLAWARLTVDAD